MGKYRVSVDKSIRDIVPGYLEAKRTELPRLFAFLTAGDLASLRRAGHKLAGSGGGYGFDRISELGTQIEDLSRADNAAGLTEPLTKLRDYIENLEIVYE